MATGGTASSPRSLNLTRRKAVGLAIAVVAILLVFLGFTWQIPVDHINTRSEIPQGLMANPVFAAVTTNTTGSIALTLQKFNYTSPDGSTVLDASSANIQVVMSPASQGNTALNMTVNMSGVNIKSPTFTGAFSTLKLTGLVIVDPQTNQLVIAMVASTSVAGILQAILGV
jgi:hypothetical protein